MAGERIIEIPIIKNYLNRYGSNKYNILEVGNVFSHYYPIKHKVIDKYEKSKFASNIDVIDFDDGKKYDLIVSISTLEHVGFDEEIKDRTKFFKSLIHLRSLLTKKGKLIFTVPLGYNPDVDKTIYDNLIKFDAVYFLKRINRMEWIQCSKKDVQGIRYNHPFKYANAIAIGILSKQ